MAIKLTIIGAGPGGYVAAIRAAQKGAQVSVVERAEVGGICLNAGCIPTKTIIASAEALELARNASDFGVEISGEAVCNLAKIRERRDKVVSMQVKGVRALLKSRGVSLIEGRGSLLSPDVVRVVQQDGTTMDVKSDRVIIATGSSPAALPGIPFDGEQVISSNEAVQLKKIPRSLLIVGAGVIGCEFAFIYRTFGAEVTIVEAMPRALSTEDQDMADIIEREFKKRKIKLMTGVKIEGAEKAGDGMLVTRLQDNREIRTEMLLVSVGRTMNSDAIGLEEIGVAKGKRGEILVNDRMETNVEGVYAIGDVTGKLLLAHVASHQGLVAAQNALGGSATMKYDVVPSGIFTMPEIGSVGLREHQAVEQGVKHRVGRFPYRTLGKSHAMGAITGLFKIVADEATDKVLGVHICGAHAADLVHEGALAIASGTTAEKLGSLIHAHPTLAEGMMEAAEDVHQTAIHIQPAVKNR
jgi:dihydrolipoamide dehydrogenase